MKRKRPEHRRLVYNSLAALKNFFHKIKEHKNSVAFAGGFIFDYFTLFRIDSVKDNAIIFFYIVISGFSIILQNKLALKEAHLDRKSKLLGYLPLAIQFTFGALFSNYIIFYSRSASLVTNWPFLICLVAFFVGNELFRRRYETMVFQLSVYFTALFAYLTFSLPIIFRQMGPAIFILSGVISLAVIRTLIIVMSRISPDRHHKNRLPLAFSIIGIYALFNFAYFTGLIPPVPLSLKEAGVYHGIVKNSDNTYTATFEKAAWYELLRNTSSVFHQDGDERTFAWSSVFAPTKLETEIIHRWFFLEEDTGEWRQTDEWRFKIVGGRDGGYRGYSVKENIAPGRFRVDILTPQNQLLGRVKFEVVEAETLKLETETR